MRVIHLGRVPIPRSLSVFHAVAKVANAMDEMVLVSSTPSGPFVSVGYHQLANRELNVPYCESHHIPIARRLVGGGAVLLDSNQTFWHLILPGAHAAIKDLYAALLPAPVSAYQRFGIKAEKRPLNDIVVGSKKIGGTGAASIGHSMVFVGSWMFDFDRELMAHVLNVPSEKFRDKTIQSLKEYMTTMKDELGTNLPTPEEAMAVLTEEFVNLLDSPAHEDVLTDAEEAEAERLAVQLFDPNFVFQNEGWITPGRKIRDGVYLYEGLHKTPTGLIRMIWLEADGWIENVWLGGDLLIEPPDALTQLAGELTKTPLLAREFPECLQSSFARHPIIGLTPEDLLAAYQQKMSITPDVSTPVK
ncbi:lipoate--protein ligase family protein [Sulfobacillus thermosulfidooxidans]|uniref:lipoate--protein ligase family protein n=1 Tax=Sulfobacillus thermosulfidooxidans TaxID=28034 RepID=UPI000416146F|nr:biotin/lipoate A/B protein ligase family protein [Sulfobacillus thermosulfidooxidans]